jgi:hypothetical protein
MVGVLVWLFAAPYYASGADLSPKAQQAFSGLRMVNWYPIDNYGTNMWAHFDLSVATSDFATIAASGFNAVRIIVTATPDTLAVPQPSQQMLGNLRDLVNAADQAGLRVQLTLFGFYFGWTPLQSAVSNGATWINAVVRPFQNDPRIAYIDVQNEIDLTDPAKFAWLQALFPYVKDAAGTIPVTASPGMPGMPLPAAIALLRSAAPVDLFDIHYYVPPEYALAQLGGLITAAGATPIYFGECGIPTETDAGDASLPATKEAREAAQEKYFRTLHAATRELGLPTPSPWTFNDALISGVPAAELGYWASLNNGLAGAFDGLRRTDMTEKPALPTLRALNSGARISAFVNEGFEAADSSGMPLYWHVLSNPGGGSTADFARDTSVAHSGSASARISNATGSTSSTPSFWVVPVQTTHSGAQYRAHVYAKGSNVTGFVRLVLAWTDANYQYITLANSQSLPNGDSDWTLLNVSTQAPLNAARLAIHLQSHDNQAGTAWFDDLVAGRIQAAVEFYASALDHYFISTDPAEIAALDSGAIKGWSRTGYSFNTYASMSIGTSPVCRFYIPPAYGDSHFFGRGVSECAATHVKFPVFDYESEEVFAMELPVNGICGGATIPVYRVFDNRADANHRYTTDRSVRDAMVAKGWVAEGDGPDAVVMCSPI